MTAVYTKFSTILFVFTCVRAIRLLIVSPGEKSDQQVSSDDKSDQQAVFYGSHNLWGDNVVFSKDRKFKRQQVVDEGGTWSVDGATLTLVWDYWGSATSWTLDGGRSFSKLGFTLQSEPPLPSWWLDLFSPARGQYLSPVAVDKQDILWTSMNALPTNEGYILPGQPDGIDSVEKCKEWCADQLTCIGIKVEIEEKTGAVKSWEPKKMASGFDPGSAVWLANDESSGISWQFHWRADPESIRRNDDGVASSILCPPGLKQRPEYTFQCWDGSGGLGFNKIHGTVNFEQLIIEEMGIAWNGITRHVEDPYRPPTANEEAIEMVQDEITDVIIDELNPLPSRVKMAAIGFLLLAKLVGHGSILGTMLADVGHGLLTYIKMTHAPAIAPLLSLFRYAQWLDDWRHRFLASNKMVAGFLFKSMCMDEVSFRYMTLRRTEFKPELEEQCGPELVEALHRQVPITLQKMRLMYDYTTAIAWCMRGGAPGLGPAYADGVKCSEDMLPAFKGADGRAGMLTAALLVTAMWGAMTDDLFIEGSELAVHAKLKIAFGIDYPELDEVAKAEGITVVSQLKTLKAEEKQLTCTSLYVSQLAYEKAFARLGKGFEVWVRTFGIDDSTWWWGYHPCGYLFNGWTGDNKTEHMCKGWTSPLGLFGSGSQCSKGRDTNLFQRPD